MAEAQLKTLKDEAEKLRSRLQKVEAGIKRCLEQAARPVKEGPLALSIKLADEGKAQVVLFTPERAPLSG